MITVYHLSEADQAVLDLLEHKFSLEAHHYAAQFDERENPPTPYWVIKAILEHCSGDVSKALDYLKGTSWGFNLGNWGMSWPNGRWIDAMGNAPTNDIYIKDHEWNPLYRITWRAVFEFVAGMPTQGRLF
ncbi:MAG: hypothetical protein GWN58_27830 [Anaerolineae bacterium]|nr:hypothetical protein [Anaerolineae bacterium]